MASAPRRRKSKVRRSAGPRGLRATAGGFSRNGKTVATPRGIFAKRAKDGRLRYYDARDGAPLTRAAATARARALLSARTRAHPDAETRRLRKQAKSVGLGLRKWGSGWRAGVPKRWSDERAAEALDAFADRRALRGYGVSPVAAVQVEYPPRSKIEPYDVDLRWRVGMRPGGDPSGPGYLLLERRDRISEAVEDRGGKTKLADRALIIYRGEKWERDKATRAVRRKRAAKRAKERAKAKRRQK